MKKELTVNKITRFIHAYLIIGLPFVIALMAWDTIHPQKEFLKNPTLLTRALWELFSWNLMIWFAILILFLIILVVSPSTREKTLRRLANLRERDEREEYITGKSSRAAYIATLSLMIFFLFFSIFSLSIYRAPRNQAINGKRLVVNIGIGFSFLDKTQPEKTYKGDVLFDSKDFSLSNSAIIFILLSWQLLIFKLTAMKEQINGQE